MLYRRVTTQGFRKNLETTGKFRLPCDLRSSSVIPASHAGCCKDVQQVYSDHVLGDTVQSNLVPCKAAAQAPMFVGEGNDFVWNLAQIL